MTLFGRYGASDVPFERKDIGRIRKEALLTLAWDKRRAIYEAAGWGSQMQAILGLAVGQIRVGANVILQEAAKHPPKELSKHLRLSGHAKITAAGLHDCQLFPKCLCRLAWA